MIKHFIFIILIANPLLILAQTIKTDVLVIGGSPSGVAAAIQSARSKVKTVLIADKIQLSGKSSENAMVQVNTNRCIASGIWAGFRRHVIAFYKNTTGYDTSETAPLKFEKAIGEDILAKMTDTVKNLSVYLNSTFVSLKKNNDRWDVKLRLNGELAYIKTRVIVDATKAGAVAATAGTSPAEIYTPASYPHGPEMYRTSIAAGNDWPGPETKSNLNTETYPPFPAWCIPAEAALIKNTENLLITEKIIPADDNTAFLPVQLELGQGVGTIAAYCAFYKTTTSHLNVRIIQGELLDFKGFLLPFTDIGQNTTAWRAIQQITASGLLKGGVHHAGGNYTFDFMPDSTVYTSEIKPALMEIYTRAFLWFNKEKPGKMFTLGNLLSFISDYSLTDPDVLTAAVGNDWKSRYHFKNSFNLQRPITRLEFAVLANRYINPFGRAVSLGGQLVN